MTSRKGFLLAALGFLACEGVTSQNIKAWKNTQKGPAKIEAALRDAKVAAKLRAEAAAALVDMDAPEKVDTIMAEIPAAARWEMLKSLVPIYVAGMGSTKVEKARSYRDALFGVREYAQPQEQGQIDGALLPSIEKDLREGRAAGGRHSIDKIMSAIGPPAAPMLVRLLGDANVPFPAVVEMASNGSSRRLRLGPSWRVTPSSVLRAEISSLLGAAAII
jgi:hypothetical protein